MTTVSCTGGGAGRGRCRGLRLSKLEAAMHGPQARPCCSRNRVSVYLRAGVSPASWGLWARGAGSPWTETLPAGSRSLAKAVDP